MVHAADGMLVCDEVRMCDEVRICDEVRRQLSAYMRNIHAGKSKQLNATVCIY